MSEEISFHERFLECLPQLLKNSRFMKEVGTDLGTPGTDCAAPVFLNHFKD
jgi:hypothetical protein